MIFNWAIKLAESGKLPDSFIRIGIRSRLARTLSSVGSGWMEENDLSLKDWIEVLDNSPVALVPEKANEQHYELPAEFFELVLGEHLKYSSGYWPNGQKTVSDAEKAMLALSCERADIKDRMSILELGCGWGSLTLWMAKEFPNCSIMAVSNSNGQREFIERRAESEGLTNVSVLTADMNDFATRELFDRVVSVEMFEHMRNYRELMRRVDSWLKPDGKLFVHIFSHNTFAYPYLDNGPNDWMATHFFSGGQMPSHNLLTYFDEHLVLEKDWRVNGNHYARTCRGWLDRMDDNKEEIMVIFERTYGKHQANMWFQRWRLFFKACEELFRFNKGNEWAVSHYLFRKRQLED